MHDKPKRTIWDTQDETNIPTLNIKNESERLILDIQDVPKQNISDITENWIKLGKPNNQMKKSK